MNMQLPCSSTTVQFLLDNGVNVNVHVCTKSGARSLYIVKVGMIVPCGVITKQR